MNTLTLKRQYEKYQSDIDLFNRMVTYKKNLQESLFRVISNKEKTKLELGQWNESLILKMVILVDNYRNALNDDEDTLYALTKSASVILSELDMPPFETFEGHFAFYLEYLKYSKNDDSRKMFLRISMLAEN